MVFVWWLENGRYSPQRWFQFDLGLNKWKEPFVAASHKLDDAQSKMTLSELVTLFPAPMES